MPELSSEGTGRNASTPGPAISSYEENSSTLAAISRLVGLWLDRRRRRRALEDIAEREYLLADVGLTREEALQEAEKPFWRA